MAVKTIKLKQAVEFTKNNGYLLAVYKKEDDAYRLYDPCHNDDIVDINTDIVVKTTGAATDFNEFTTKDKQYCFRLHNNFNIPKIIPIIKPMEIITIPK